MDTPQAPYVAKAVMGAVETHAAQIEDLTDDYMDTAVARFESFSRSSSATRRHTLISKNAPARWQRTGDGRKTHLIRDTAAAVPQCQARHSRRRTCRAHRVQKPFTLRCNFWQDLGGALRPEACNRTRQHALG